MEQMLLKRKSALNSPTPTNDDQKQNFRAPPSYNRQQSDDPTQVKMAKSSRTQWIRQQERAFTGWVNAHLQTRSMRIKSLEKDIATVTPLIHLLEVLEKKPLREVTKYHRAPRHKFDQLDGLRLCLKQIRSRGRKDIKVGFDAEVLLRGEEKKAYLALIWRIIVNYAIEETTAEEVLDNKRQTFKTPDARLRWWCNSRLTSDLQISNFTKDWSDGKVLVHLMNQALDEHERITAEDVQDMDTEELLEGLLRLGDKHLHIPQLLDPSDLMRNPNKEAVMTYVSLLRTAIESKDKERSAAEASMGKMQEAFAKLEDNWLQRVKDLETRLEEAQQGQAEYAEKLQEERHTNSKQRAAAKHKTDALFEQIEALKAQVGDQAHQHEMLVQDAEGNKQRYKQQVQRLQTQQLQLQAHNDALTEQLKEVMTQKESDSAQMEQSAAAQEAHRKQLEQQRSAFELQVQSVKDAAAKDRAHLEGRVAEVEAQKTAQREKFNEFYEQYKAKLEASNAAGREFREKCIVITADTEALRRRIAELEALLAAKQKELEEARLREKELMSQLATQETVFRIQLQELGQFIKEMKAREKQREKQQVEAYHKLLKEREQRIKMDKQRKRKSGLAATATKDGKIALNAVDVEAQRMALEQFERRKSRADQYPQSAPPTQRQVSQGQAHNPLLYDEAAAAVGGQASEDRPQFDRKTEAVRTKFGNEKMISTWLYTGKDGRVHEVILRHNTRSGKDLKSKRVIVVDGKVRYAEKSKETHFIIKNGRDQLKLNIAPAQGKGFVYQLFINDVSFTNLHNNFLNQIASL